MSLVYQIEKLENLINFKIENISQRLGKLELLQEDEPNVQTIVESITSQECEMCFEVVPKHCKPTYIQPIVCNDFGMEME